MDKTTLFNWIGDPWGSAFDWIADNLARQSRPAISATVPELHGMFVPEARSTLARAGLRIKVIEPATHAGPAQVIVRQEPAAGLSAKPGTTVTVYVEQPTARGGPAYAW